MARRNRAHRGCPGRRQDRRRPHHPPRKRADFPRVSPTRGSGLPAGEPKQMIPETSGSAAPDGLSPWPDREVVQAHGIVRRLQKRIVKAVQQGKWRKVRALQHLLTHSRSAKRLAVLRVTENPGKNTPGVDGVTWSTLKAKRDAVATLRQRGYRPQPLR